MDAAIPTARGAIADPASVVSAQADAYNARDLERFLGCYTPNCVIEDGTGQVLVQGHDGMRGLYGQLFAQSPELRCDLQQRIRVGQYVIDEEAITGINLAGFPTDLHSAVVYRVEGDRIALARLLM
jgi:hypothetical protein